MNIKTGSKKRGHILLLVAAGVVIIFGSIVVIEILNHPPKPHISTIQNPDYTNLVDYAVGASQ